ncbi:GAF and ANTAR domain-containing protein [Nocardia otitidiscaviarum]|uniref:GAF and ANTAR domain-containing protein n=1 Tax=Nocardia otitidiscaviarum TaxID=1823 RepID=UPI0018949BAD|nr:GAF and ANTAR domain-containing protein [Nocardia otitidiscaviarum]MBF6236403.1 GAF and ANTAR domain-containing protein [Nocardia otitidiscaviarum]
MVPGRSAPDELARGLAALTAVMVSTRDVAVTLRDFADTASTMLPGHPLTGVTLHREPGPLTVGSGGSLAMPIDEVANGDGEGPCREAIENGRPVSVPDTAAERRWGRYPARMLAHGVRSVHFEPLLTDGAAIGALHLYSPRAHGFDETVRAAIELTATQIAVLLDAALATARQAELTAQLREALGSRAVIDQALGMIMMQRRCGPEEAFGVLRTASHQRNVKLVRLAADMVRTITGNEPIPPHFGVDRATRSRRGR